MMTSENSNILLPATDSLEDIPVPQNPLNIKEPIKSSNEILSELFSAFNAKPPNLIEDIALEYSKTNSDHEINSDISLKHTKKHKKHKKHKKVKKRTRSLSEASEVSCNGKKSKKRKKKRSKLKDNISSSESTSSKSRKHKRRKVESSDSEGSNSNDNRKENIKTPEDINNSLVVIKKEPNDKPDIYVHQSEDIAKRISETIGNVLNSVPLVVSPKKEVEKDPIKKVECQVDPLSLTAPKSAPDLESEDSKDVQQHLDKPKPTRGKIQIKNLKFSSVFEETVRQVEEKAKLKAERYEEGEISDSSSEPQRSPSPISSDLGSVQNSSNEIVPKEKKEKKKHRHHHKSRERYRSRSREGHRSLSRSHSNKSKYKDRQDDKSNEKFSRSKERNRSKERIRHRSRESRSRSQERHREKSKDKSRERSRERKSYERTKEKSYRHHHRHSSSSHRHHSYSKDHSDRASEDRIDKRKLLEIARKNALSMLKTPQAASDMAKVTITAGGKTVDELTDFCKLLSKKDADGHESISSDTSHSSDSESEKPFHHPFQIKDRPSNIVMNIRNSVALPVKTMQEKTAEQSRQLRLQFPVSSGQQHRKTDAGHWIDSFTQTDGNKETARKSK
uniref:Protein SON n=1 Tax=Clastoptera arizonana TaxID=38151 RepID=A0A1B6DNG7_9HEMI